MNFFLWNKKDKVKKKIKLISLLFSYFCYIIIYLLLVSIEAQYLWKHGVPQRLSFFNNTDA